MDFLRIENIILFLILGVSIVFALRHIKKMLLIGEEEKCSKCPLMNNSKFSQKKRKLTLGHK